MQNKLKCMEHAPSSIARPASMLSHVFLLFIWFIKPASNSNQQPTLNRKRAVSHGGKRESFRSRYDLDNHTITHQITDYLTSLQVPWIGTRKINLYRTIRLAGVAPTCSRVSCARLDQSQRNMCTSWLRRLKPACIYCVREGLTLPKPP